MKPAFVDKLTRESNGVENLLVRQHMFDRKMDARRLKTKDSNETLKTFPKTIEKETDRMVHGNIKEGSLLEESITFVRPRVKKKNTQ